ncbi:MAG: ATP-binding cassette domain-containing protein [Flavobacteriales bacterium]|nr:ATP-binding cassette domain-containing protein [Flavobacteriales bacterium]
MAENFDSKLPLKRFISMLRPDRRDIIYLLFYAVIAGAINLSLPLGIQAIIGFLMAGTMSVSWVVLSIVVILGVAFAGVLQILQLFITESLQQKIFTRSAQEFAMRITRFKTESIQKYYPPDLVNRFFDTLTVQKGLPKILLEMSAAVLQIIFGLILLSLYHPFFILLGSILLILLGLIFRLTWEQALLTSLKESGFKYKVAHWLEEVARVFSTFKLAGNAQLPITNTDKLVTGYLHFRNKHFKVLVFQFSFILLFKITVVASLLIIGSLLVINKEINLGQFVASEIVIVLLLTSVEKLILSMETLYDVLTGVEKIGQVTDIPIEEENNTTSLLSKNKGGLSVKIRRMNFHTRGERKALDDIFLQINTDEKVCIVGANASGKSVLLQIISGLYNETNGEISYDGIPSVNINRNELRVCIGDVLENEEIFSGTVIDNISLGRPGIDLSTIARTCELVCLSPFIETLPEGYNTLLQDGSAIPRSAVRKILLARALVGFPRMLVADDFSVGLDQREVLRLSDNLLTKLKDCTLLAAVSREAVAAKFPRIIVLSGGKIVGDGSYESLKNTEEFRKIFEHA